ncbi:hypothetical protein HYFRA_00000947, partial [Hymenoscyphus fraxineus]
MANLPMDGVNIPETSRIVVRGRRRAQAKALHLAAQEPPLQTPPQNKRTEDTAIFPIPEQEPVCQVLSTHPYQKVEQCIHPVQWELIRQASNATPYSTYKTFDTYTQFSTHNEPIHRPPLPIDHFLLPLMHFNLIRALFQNIHLLGLDPKSMSQDILSPFCLQNPTRRPHLTSLLPPDLQPTTTQRLVPHHPELDILPFPEIRDAFILSQSKYDEFELCHDLIFGVERSSFEGGGAVIGDGTGLRVWSDPWCAGSWEVEEGFARKYWELMCEELLRSTNMWREMRGEEPLGFGLGNGWVLRIVE